MKNNLWDTFVCFTIDEENWREPAKQQRRGAGGGFQWDVSLYFYFLSELTEDMLLFNLIFKPVNSFKIIHFVHSEQKLTLLVVPGWLHILTLIISFLYLAFINTNVLRFLCHFAVCSGKFWHFSILERFEIKGWQNDDLLSMTIIILNTPTF